MMKKKSNYLFLSFLSLLFQVVIVSPLMAANTNYVTIDIDELGYRRPHENKGSGGILKFSRVKLSWDEMKVSLKNNADFLDAKMTVRPDLINFKTSGVGLTFPMVEDSVFFTIAETELKSSRFFLNSDFFNFDGEIFTISDGVSKLILDKFNIYCNAIPEVDMTSLDGLINGCLTQMILNGKNKEDLAGAQIDYYENAEDEKGIYLKSRLKEFKLENERFSLDLNKAHLDVEGFGIDIGKSEISCQKNEELKTLEFDDLKNGCVNSISIVSPKVDVKNLEDESRYSLNLKSLKTTNDSIEAELPNVILSSESGKTIYNKIKIDCFRELNSDFYDLHETIAGCMKKATISIDEIIGDSTGIEEEVSLTDKAVGWFMKKTGLGSDSDDKKSMFAHTLNATVTNNKLIFSTIVDYGIIPKFNFEFEAYLTHDREAGTLNIEIMHFKTAKFVTLRKALIWGAKFSIGEEDNITVNDRSITIQL